MTFRIACAVFALSVWLINRFAVDTCSGGESPHEKVVCGRNILVNEERNNAVDLRH